MSSTVSSSFRVDSPARPVSAAHLRTLIDQMPVAVAMVDRQFNYLAVSQRFRETFHDGQPALIGQARRDSVPGFSPLWRERLQRAIAGEATQIEETSAVDSDGSQAALSWNIGPWLTDDGTIGGAIITANAVISAPRPATFSQLPAQSPYQSLDDARRKEYAELLANSPDLIFKLDRQYRHLFVAGPVKAMVGVEADNVIGKTGRELGLPIEVCERFERVCDEVFASGQRRDFEFEHRGRWFLNELAPEASPDGRVESLIGLAQDITARKQAEQLLAESEQRLRLATEAAGIGAYEANYVTGRVKLSPLASKIVGLDAEAELNQAEAFRLIHPDDVQKLGAAQGQLFDPRSDGRGQPVQVRVYDRRGEIHWIAINGQVEFREGPHGRYPYRQVGAVIDVTQTALTEAALKDADRRKDEFLATLAHELRNPLAPILNGLQILRMLGNPDAEQIEIHDMVQRQVMHMVRLIDDLLDLSRITRGKLQLKLESLDVRDVVRRALETARPTIQAAGHELRRLACEQPLTVEGDPFRLAQVLNNLLANAVKYTPHGGRIDISASREGRDAVVRVSDTGAGIAPHVLPHIFEMFMQSDQTLAQAQGGLGIGLSLVKKLVEMHGGRVEADSGGPGRGSRFTVRLPLVVTAHLLQDGHAGAASSGESGRLRVLIADDQRDIADSLAALLKVMGHEAQTAYDGQAAVDLAASFEPDVVLLDVGMPRLDGYEVCRRLRQQAGGDRMLIAAQTGWGQDEDPQRALSAGFDEHLTKPVAVAALKELLSLAAERRTNG